MRRIFVALSFVVCAGVLSVARPAAAKLEGAEWTAAEQRFRQLFAQPGESEAKVDIVKTVAADGEARAWKLLAEGTILEAAQVARSAERLGKAITDLQALLGKKLSEMYPKDREEMYRLQVEVSDLERTKGGSDAVVRALVAAFVGGTADARHALLILTKSHKEWSVRAIGVRVAAVAPDEPDAKAMLAEALGAKEDPRVKFAALDALKGAQGSTWQDLVVARVEDPDWGVQVLAARIAGEREIGKAIPALIKALGAASPRVAEEVVGALRKLTGQSMEPYAEPWAKWWEANRAKWGADGRPLQPVVSVARPSDADFYGIKIKSDKVMFIIDISGSMKLEKQQPAQTAPPHGAVTGDDKPKAPPKEVFSGPKIEIAKKELIRALKALPKEATFDIIAFNHGVMQWQPKMVAATEANKEAAYAWIRDMAPAGSTYIDGALRLAFKMAGMGAYDKAYPGVAVDTIMLLSDGAPTDNAFPESKNMEPKEILDHVKEWNPQQRVKINCIGIDNVVQGIKFMKDLAAQNGGTYVDG